LKIYCSKLVANLIPHVSFSEKECIVLLHDEADGYFKVKLWNGVGKVFTHKLMGEQFMHSLSPSRKGH
jgi:hypothetical protein